MFTEEEVQRILNHYNLPDKPYVGLCRLFVHKSLRSHGIGTYLIKQMEEKYIGQNFILLLAKLFAPLTLLLLPIANALAPLATECLFVILSLPVPTFKSGLFLI